jgi:hypothetical protein
MIQPSFNHFLLDYNYLFYQQSENKFEIGFLGFELIQFLPENDLRDHFQTLKDHLTKRSFVKIENLLNDRLSKESHAFCERIGQKGLNFLANFQDIRDLLDRQKGSFKNRLDMGIALGDWEFVRSLLEEKVCHFQKEIDLKTLHLAVMWENEEFVSKILHLIKHSKPSLLFFKLPTWDEILKCTSNLMIYKLLVETVPGLKTLPHYFFDEKRILSDPKYRREVYLFRAHQNCLEGNLDSFSLNLHSLIQEEPREKLPIESLLKNAIFSQNSEVFTAIFQQLPRLDIDNLSAKEQRALLISAAFSGEEKIISFLEEYYGLGSYYATFYASILSGNPKIAQIIFYFLNNKYVREQDNLWKLILDENLIIAALSSGNVEMVALAKNWAGIDDKTITIKHKVNGASCCGILNLYEAIATETEGIVDYDLFLKNSAFKINYMSMLRKNKPNKFSLSNFYYNTNLKQVIGIL